MSPEAQRIAIAEACGLKIGPTGYDQHSRKVLDYLSELNAIHEAEKVLTTYEQQSEYFNTLKAIVAPGWTYSSTAAQRAEAFLKTLNLWTP